MPRTWLWGSVLLLALASCGDDDNSGTPEDAGSDAGANADAGRDAGDAGRDAGRDAGAAPDAGHDSGTPVADAGGMDAASDAASSDSGTNATDASDIDANDLDATASDSAAGDASESDAGELDASGETDSGGGDTGTADSGTTADAGSDAGPTVTFDEIYEEIIKPTCGTGCHGTGHPSGLDLSSEQVAYADLVGVNAGEGGSGSECGGRGLKRVVAGDADSSLLVLKIEPSPPCGNQMPRGGRPLLSSDEIARIRAWIDQGAAATTP